MSDRIIFDDAIEAIDAGAKLSESDKKILRAQLVDAVLGNHLKVFAKGSQAPYDFKSVRGAAGLQSARFGKNNWDAVKTFQAEIYAVDLDEWLEKNWQKLKFRFGIITDTLFDSRLSDREFGSHLIHVPSLLNWAGPTHFPETNPQIDAYKFVQVEALLYAIERVSQSMTTEQTLNIVRSQPEHQLHPAVINNNGQLARWLLGADAHLKWRKLIASGVKVKKLRLLDFASKLPISDEDVRALLMNLPGVNPSGADLNQAGGSQAANQAGDEAKQAPPLEHWKLRVQQYAAELWQRILDSGANPSVSNTKDAIATWCVVNDVRTDSANVHPTAEYLRSHVLSTKHWTNRPTKPTKNLNKRNNAKLFRRVQALNTAESRINTRSTDC